MSDATMLSGFTHVPLIEWTKQLHFQHQISIPLAISSHYMHFDSLRTVIPHHNVVTLFKLLLCTKFTHVLSTCLHLTACQTYMPERVHVNFGTEHRVWWAPFLLTLTAAWPFLSGMEECAQFTWSASPFLHQFYVVYLCSFHVHSLPLCSHAAAFDLVRATHRNIFLWYRSSPGIKHLKTLACLILW